ncbi:hypothetical protein BAOM_3026 [Peribacillus asahii]|uniref:Uncharacterized protein n=1 Tax=Peribacillus asahii TaxID=228899 RepID=A0A3Q9RPA0_9BACI|nr:hypothetical protein [Peribacillus asahii]AZV43635.1 hypothetical protein BAOM_3026 [Peribacillus asahii]
MERLNEIMNRKPSKWGNLTIKEFERDIKLLQETCRHLVINDKYVNLLEEQRKELISLSLWSARRLHKIHKNFAYNELDKITEQKHERL